MLKKVYLSIITSFWVVSLIQTGNLHAKTAFNIITNEYNSEPYLVSGKSIEYPAVLLKKKIMGTITIEADISEKGIVEKCTIKERLFPMIDSIVYDAIINSRFSQAYDMGNPVPSTIVIQIPFEPDSILVQSNYSVAELEGAVYEQDSKIPQAGVTVNLQYKDTTSDTLLSGNFGEYMEIIGKVPGQVFKNGFLSTRTDSNGHFTFRLLPDGSATIALLAKGYAIKHFEENVQTGYNKKVHYYLETYKDNFDTSYTITVYGIDSSKREIVNLERQQYSSGLTHYLSKILLTKATIRQVPEAASALLVRSGSPYDNCYLISGVPMLAPFHFGGYPYADIDGVMVSTLDKINVTVDRIAGTFPNVSGALIEANPGIYRPAPKKLKKRKELTIDFSTISQDFLLSFPFRKQDYLQVGFTHSENHTLKWLSVFQGVKEYSGVSIAPPKTFGNLTFTGKMLFNKTQTEYFSWFAYDAYCGRVGEIIPWGMASVKMYPVSNKKISLITGGGHQYFVDGIRVGKNSFLKKAYLTNGIFTLNRDSIKSNIVNMNISGAFNYQKWDGHVEQRDTSGLDTSINRNGNEITFNCKTTLFRNIGPLELSANILFTGIHYDEKPELIVDAGVSLLWESEFLDIGCNIGKVTSRPDIRGLPDYFYRKEKANVYVFSLPVNMKIKEIASLGVQPYARYQDNTPQLDPLFKTWNPALSTPVKAAGADCDLQLKPFTWLELSSAVNMSNAYREKESDSTYEWNIPLSVRGRVHFLFYHSLFHFYLEWKSSKGLPYYDFVVQHYQSLPDYKRLDFSLQYRSPIDRNGFLSRYDAYFVVSNILNNFNVRAYYWNENMINHPVRLLGPTYVEIGVRFGFRL